MKCPNCNKQVPTTANVCGYCGTKLEKKQEIFCPDCGKEVPANAIVCGFCGAKLVHSASKNKKLKPSPAKKAAEPKVETTAVKPEKKVVPPKVKGGTRKLNIPKWAFAVVGGVILIALVLFFVVPSLSPGSKVGESTSLLPFSGHWIGEIEGINNDFSATIEINFKRYCSIGEICGSYKTINADDFGDLELITINNDVYKFKEHSKGEDPLAGIKYQSVRLVGESLKWSFKQTVSPNYESTGTLFRK